MNFKKNAARLHAARAPQSAVIGDIAVLTTGCSLAHLAPGAAGHRGETRTSEHIDTDAWLHIFDCKDSPYTILLLSSLLSRYATKHTRRQLPPHVAPRTVTERESRHDNQPPLQTCRTPHQKTKWRNQNHKKYKRLKRFPSKALAKE